MLDGYERLDGPVEGWKVLDKNMRCRGMQFAVGETYELPEGTKPVMCAVGYHFSRTLRDCYKYKHDSLANHACRVRAEGVILDGGDKLCASRLTILEDVPLLEAIQANNKGELNSGLDNEGDRNTGDCNKGDRNTGQGNHGSRNTGNSNCGSNNTGCGNEGRDNTGSHNKGDDNAGFDNRGHLNTGNGNIGDGNTGSCNLGDRNTGTNNLGDMCTGMCNIASMCTGVFNSLPDKIRVFDQQTDLQFQELRLPDFCYALQLTTDSALEHPWGNRELHGGKPDDDLGKSTQERRWTRWTRAWLDIVRRARDLDDWNTELTRLMALPGFSFIKFQQVTGVPPAELLRGTRRTPDVAWPVVSELCSAEFMALVDTWIAWAGDHKDGAKLPGARARVLQVEHVGRSPGKDVLEVAAACPDPAAVLTAAANRQLVGFVLVKPAGKRHAKEPGHWEPVIRRSALHRKLRHACHVYLRQMMREALDDVEGGDGNA